MLYRILNKARGAGHYRAYRDANNRATLSYNAMLAVIENENIMNDFDDIVIHEYEDNGQGEIRVDEDGDFVETGRRIGMEKTPVGQANPGTWAVPGRRGVETNELPAIVNEYFLGVNNQGMQNEPAGPAPPGNNMMMINGGRKYRKSRHRCRSVRRHSKRRSSRRRRNTRRY